MASYPEDEFDRLPPTGRRGAHRKETGAGMRGAYVVIAVAAVVAVLLVIGVFNIIRTSFKDPEDQVAEPPVAEETESPGEESAEETDEAAPEVDKSEVSVAVYNGSGVNGAGARFSEAVEANGWPLEETATYATPDTTSTVFYASSDHEDHAAALAAELGIEQVEESADFTADVTAVITSDIAEQGPPGADGGATEPEGDGADPDEGIADPNAGAAPAQP
ncbi:LytR C-terminal domain-containing protein [Brevibacterium jeotgali]|uniref:LytR cell envelope-related transcriptional attenuator n=1 Tax=Brevibacterium jeotgali TaxID=1262550 RepID=A0A2H1L4J1_9MICO|nr:LytR C-terminal domain-containing protein [Brevibacterium jeotgali]TWB98720.1 LytR cell envelope-related transcriptional attenuator [Brevibacterium jeotgali]SMY11680.1 LytR cell envelope-related transcriptional attenuator [Brevibacterium jeotgali]